MASLTDSGTGVGPGVKSSIDILTNNRFFDGIIVGIIAKKWLEVHKSPETGTWKRFTLL
jgi:hypothetical protein